MQERNPINTMVEHGRTSRDGGRRAVRLTRLGLICAVALVASLLPVVQNASARMPVEGDYASPAVQAEAVVWSSFYPSDWISALPLSAGVAANSPDGLVTTSARFRTSSDGGVTWSEWSSNGLNATLVDPATLQIAVNGINLPDSALLNRIQFQVATGEGQTEQSTPYMLRIDTVAPAAPLALVSTPDGWTNVNSFRVSWTNPLDTSGIVGAYYRFNSEPLFPSDGTFVATSNAIDGIRVPAEGAYAVLVWLVDGAGNVDHLNYRVDLEAFRYDATPPTVQVTSQGPLGLSGWYTGTATLGFTPADATSGVLTWGWQLDGAPASTAPTVEITDNGLHNVLINAADRAGNAMTPIDLAVAVDAEQPQLGYSVAPPPAASGWFTAPLTVSFVITDQVSGPGQVTWRLNNDPPESGNVVFLVQDGFYMLAAVGQDVAGNRSSPVSLSLPLDSNPPNTAAVLNPPEPQPSGFYTRPVSLRFEASDVLPTTPPVAGSGVAGTRMRVNNGPWQGALPLTFTTSGVRRIDYYSFDVAGNVEISRTEVISVDLEPPDAPIAPTIDPPGWSADNLFSLSWENPPDASGVAGAYVWIGQDVFDPDAAVFYPDTTRIDNLTVPSQGEWQVWMALRDRAGQRGAYSNVGALRYDSSPPSLLFQADGPAGNAGWFTGPTQVTLAVEDAGSGPEFLRYRLNGEPWQQTVATATLTLEEPGRHMLDYYGQDRAGFVVGPELALVRIDPDPPTAPIAAVVTPTTWSNANQWMLSWRNPVDTSGVALAHWSFQAPAGPQDGQTVAAGPQMATLEAPAEGSYDLYLWLEDAAGNASIDQVAALAGAVRYDATPPLVDVQLIPTPNAAGWWRSPVAVTVLAEDSLSGVVSVTWQLDQAPPATDPNFVVGTDGEHSLVVSASDQAGNSGQETRLLRIDTMAPQAWLVSVPTYHPSPQILVQWGGLDVAAQQEGGEAVVASGLAGFDVQVRQGAAGAWQTWLPAVSDTSAVFQGQRGQLYSFRVRAVDLAGNASPWATAGGSNWVLIDPVDNGFFTSQNLDGWTTNSTLGLSLIEEVDLMPGTSLPVARLGTPIWQACADPGNIPTLMCGDSWSSISQQIAVPSLEDVPNPTLEVWYRVQSYDQITTTSAIWNVLCPANPPPAFRWVDSFDVTTAVVGAGQTDYLLRDGNSEAQFPLPIELRDLTWQRAELDLTPYAGQNLVVELASHNRLDSRFNTWTDVYGIRVRGELRQVFLPMAPMNVEPEVVEPQVCWPNQDGQPSVDASPVTPLDPIPSQESIR